MQVNQKSANSRPSTSSGARSTGLLLSVDTCGPSGSVALGQLNFTSLTILGLTPLEGRSYSATLVAAVADLLANNGASLRDLQAIVAVNGPGSFTGVRVGLSAIKGLAEPASTPVVAVSRLVVLAMKAKLGSSALDAHRHEVFLRIGSNGTEGMESLAGHAELAAIDPTPAQIAVCDEAAADLLANACPALNFCGWMLRTRPTPCSRTSHAFWKATSSVWLCLTVTTCAVPTQKSSVSLLGRDNRESNSFSGFSVPNEISRSPRGHGNRREPL